MYHAPIVRAKVASTPARRGVGVVALLIALAVMVLWLALNAVLGVTLLGLKGAVRAPRALLEMVDYAGGVFVGR